MAASQRILVPGSQSDDPSSYTDLLDTSTEVSEDPVVSELLEPFRVNYLKSNLLALCLFFIYESS